MAILLIEDDAAYARTLARGLASRKYRVVVAPSAVAARKHTASGDIDLILLDRGLPDGDGIDLCASLRAEGLGIPILILTGRDEITEQVEGYRAGADEYVVKPVYLDVLCAKIAAHLRPKQANLRREIGTISLDERAAAVFVQGRKLRLSPTEYAIFSALAVHVDQAIDGDHLAALVWGPSWKLERGTLYTNISRLRAKLGAAAAHLTTDRGHGWILRSQPSGETVLVNGRARRTPVVHQRRSRK